MGSGVGGEEKNGRKKWKKKREGKNGASATTVCGSWGRKKWKIKKMGVNLCESSK